MVYSVRQLRLCCVIELRLALGYGYEAAVHSTQSDALTWLYLGDKNMKMKTSDDAVHSLVMDGTKKNYFT